MHITIFKWFSNLKDSDQIALMSSIASFLLAIVAIWQSRKSIKLTEKSIIEANRPVIVAYMDVININSVDDFLIIKNFGQTPAVIKKFETKNLDVMLNLADRLNSMNNIILAPNQKIITQLISKDGLQGDIQPFEIFIEYKDSLNISYEDNYFINPEFTKSIITARRSLNNLTNSDKNLNEIASALIKELK